ncbi:hypothetical protein GCM10011332_19860 [Terasakiella brassicae]|uniref:Uncharacterized protein n=1 Tax=Terasakiella brassicae TaxID=1634917 RepID=A0A917FCU1_9PROT|nr:hypothetical protein [Terasakiella brassicae]GGF65785.1 hypothetical protein GCM10011332_19860 [Terasakiella brassicae]
MTSDVYWETAGIAAGVSIVINIGGWWINHHLAMNRQKRSEAKDKMTRTIDAIRLFRDKSCEYWAKNGSSPECILIEGEMHSLADDFLTELDALKRQFKCFEFVSGIRLKQAATGYDFADPNRIASNPRCNDIRAKSQSIVTSIEEAFSRSFH